MDSINLVPYIEDDRLYDYAAACARTLRPEGMDDGRSEAQTLRRCFQEAERCHTLLQRRYEGASHIPAACEWLLDNFYLLQREYPAVRRTDYGAVPGTFAGGPRQTHPGALRLVSCRLSVCHDPAAQ